jgi:hypothetical protein
MNWLSWKSNDQCLMHHWSLFVFLQNPIGLLFFLCRIWSDRNGYADQKWSDYCRILQDSFPTTSDRFQGAGIPTKSDCLMSVFIGIFDLGIYNWLKSSKYQYRTDSINLTFIYKAERYKLIFFLVHFFLSSNFIVMQSPHECLIFKWIPRNASTKKLCIYFIQFVQAY